MDDTTMATVTLSATQWDTITAAVLTAAGVARNQGNQDTTNALVVLASNVRGQVADAVTDAQDTAAGDEQRERDNAVLDGLHAIARRVVPA
jgi:hypothetical protein